MLRFGFSAIIVSARCPWGLSSAAERTVHIREVTGSNPVAPTILLADWQTRTILLHEVLAMKVTILGKYSPFPPVGGACLSYWVESEGTGILVDCGPGALAKFQEYVGPLSKIDVVILSHLHFDHIGDALVLRYAAAAAPRDSRLPSKVTVYAPNEPEQEFSYLNYKEAMSVVPVAPGDSISLGGIKVDFFLGNHPLRSHAMRFEDESGIFAYSGDSTPCQDLIDAASGADLFLCEAAGTEAEKAMIEAAHCTGKQAGMVAKEAGAKRLLLTHLWPFTDESLLKKECAEVFPNVEIAREGASYEVGS